jgi:hypothetical protein
LLARTGKVKLGDFGLIVSSKDDAEEPITSTLSIPGTLQYMPPEVLTGSVPNQKSDLYALGLTMLFMLLGELPISGDSFSATVQLIARGEVVNQIPETLPPTWRTLLKTMLDRDPAERPASAKLVFDMLTNISPPAVAGGDEKSLELYVREHGSIPGLPVPVEPPRPLLEPEKTVMLSSVQALVQTLAGQIAQFQSSVQAITVALPRRDIERSLNVQPGEGADLTAQRRVQQTFEAIRRRLDSMYKISLAMMVVLFVVLVGAVAAAAVFALFFRQPLLSIVFGSGGVVSLVGVLLWKPMDKILLTTIVMQQLELIQLNFSRALTGTRQERREAFKDVSLQLQMLLTKVTPSQKGR